MMIKTTAISRITIGKTLICFIGRRIPTKFTKLTPYKGSFPTQLSVDRGFDLGNPERVAADLGK